MDEGTSRPSTFAVLRLTTRSKLIGVTLTEIGAAQILRAYLGAAQRRGGGRPQAGAARTRTVATRLRRTSLSCFGIKNMMGSPTPARTKIDRMFRLISAGFAGPDVSNTMIGTMLRPDHARESRNELSTALRTLTDQ